MEKFKASIVITTKNRRDELVKAIESCLMQKGNPEILIFDDGSEDGTLQLVKDNYPTVRTHREENCIGLINARTKAAQLITGNIIFSIDDDAIFSQDNIIIDILKDFENPTVGAVAIPLINIKYSSEILQCAPDKKTIYYTQQFIGTAHALRKDIFHQIGGYRSYLVRQGEEMDYCIRMLDAGYLVKLGYSNPIIHNESPKRDPSKIKYFEARNNILFILQNIPILFLFPHLLFNLFNLTRKNSGHIKAVCNGIFSGLKDFFFSPIIIRKPVTNSTYLHFRKLRLKR